MTTGKLLLVDGTQLLYRSFFGIRALSTASGQPTNAVYGFIRGIHQLVECWKPTHLAVAWDGGTPEYRLRLIHDYKAQRPPMPDDLRCQIEPAEEFLKLAGIARILIDGQEADDVLASVVRAGAPQFSEVLLSTTDKDLLQLVSGNTFIVPWGKSGQRTDDAAVRERTGVAPCQIIDWLALTGDTVDNIPGIPGLGPKTACKLLAQFDNLETLWLRIDEVMPSRLREALVSNRALVERNREVVALRDDLDCVPDWETLVYRPEQPAQMRSFYMRLEFSSLIKDDAQKELF